MNFDQLQELSSGETLIKSKEFSLLMDSWELDMQMSTEPVFRIQLFQKKQKQWTAQSMGLDILFEKLLHIQ